MLKRQKKLSITLALICALSSLQAPARASANSISVELASRNEQLNQLFELTRARSYFKAEIVCDRLLRLFPNDPACHLAAASLFHDMGQVSNAEAEYNEVLKISPRSVEAMVALSQISLQKLDTEQALRWARQAANTNPRSTTARLALLRALVESGLLREGDELVRQLLKEDDKNAEVQYAAYKFHLKQGQLPLAQQHLENAIKSGPRRFDWLVDLSDVYKAQGDFFSAQVCLDKALEIDPFSTEALTKLAIVLEFSLHQYDAAIAVYKRILAIEPESVTALAGLDRCKVKKNDLASALRLQIRGLAAEFAQFWSNLQIEIPQ